MKPYYEHGGITIYHGDCLGVLPALYPVHLVVTSPPYYNARDYAQWSDYSSYLDAMRAVLSALVVHPGRMVCLNSSPVIETRKSRSSRSRRFNIPADIHAIATQLGWWFQEDIVWEKPEGSAVNRSQRFSIDRHPLQWRANACTERILVYQTPTSQLNDEIIATYGGRDRVGQFARSDIWKINPSTDSEHPATFPAIIPHRLIAYYSWTGDVILDPFMGSGTSLWAAQQSRRKAIGIEIEERYCEIAAKRLAQEVLPLEHIG